MKHTLIGTLAAAEIRPLLQDNGFPVKDVFTPYESQGIWAAVQVNRRALRALKTDASEFCTKIGSLVFRHKCGMQIHRLLIVGDDIDPFNFNGVI
jgi:UbiD family decarboxylase